LAGVEQLVAAGDLTEYSRVVVVLTGSGARWSTEASSILHEIPRIHGAPSELEACLTRSGITP